MDNTNAEEELKAIICDCGSKQRFMREIPILRNSNSKGVCIDADLIIKVAEEKFGELSEKEKFKIRNLYYREVSGRSLEDICRHANVSETSNEIVKTFTRGEKEILNAHIGHVLEQNRIHEGESEEDGVPYYNKLGGEYK